MAKALSIHVGVDAMDAAGTRRPRSCTADARAMHALAVDAGYHPLALLLNEAATVAAFRARLAEAAQLARGDRLLLTFAGHGTASTPRPRHYDEAWCFHDGTFVDDQVNLFLCELAAGVRVTVVSDSCYSGSMLEVPLVVQESPEDPSSPIPPCSAVLLAACADDLTARGTETHGIFTAALIEVWDRGRFAGGHDAFMRAIAARTGEQAPKLRTRGADDPDFLAARPFSPV